MQRQIFFQVALWGGLYLLLALLPLFMALGMPEMEPIGSDRLAPRGFWVEFGVALGITGYSVLALQFATTARFDFVAPFFGADTMVQFHRQTGILSLVLILGHPIVLILADWEYLAFLDPRVNFLRAVFLVVATICLLLVVGLPLYRASLGLSYEWWRITHGALSAVVIFVGAVHSIQVGHYVAGAVPTALWVIYALVAVGLLVHTRVLKPLAMRSTPYTVADVRNEADEVAVISFAPDGHEGMRFDAGQYAWITISSTPFTLQQHPFSFSSSAERHDRLEFAVKSLGDFTSLVGSVSPGVRAYLEGPYGALRLDPEVKGAMFILGGIGVTPGLSILRTCRDRGDRRPFTLLYANNALDAIAFREEFDQLEKEINLRVVHVINNPPAGWQGERGYVTSEVIDRNLPDLPHEDVQFIICGPTPMMDMVEEDLLKRGVPSHRIFSERFSFV